MSMMGDVKRQIGKGIPSNIEDNPRRQGKEHMKEIALQSGKVLSSPETTTTKKIAKNNDDPQEKSLEAGDEPEPEEVTTSVAETEKEITKDSADAQILFSSTLEEKQKRDEDEFVPNYTPDMFGPTEMEQEEEVNESEKEEDREEEEEDGSEEMDFEEDD
ncbi:glutamic acid-rich protein-like [Gossypium hirsutum]|uniref:Glutamic acid-rich protein-like n=1 Tax=Gossypium hirsutum TaxID=3635 RepID=A0ABM2ZNP2_GOSHI|nr:glutamic acid-rich protein-like [Gossypium hirsutum]